MNELRPDPDQAHDSDDRQEIPRRRRSLAPLASAASGAGAAVISFRPVMLMLIDAAGIQGGSGRSCTMEQAAQCAVTEGPSLVGALLEVLVVVVATIVLTGGAGLVVLLTLLVPHDRTPAVRIALGTFLVTFSLVGVVALVAAAH